MKLSLDVTISLLSVALVFGELPLIVDQHVLVVHVERFDDDMDVCRQREVCADVFNFTRDHGNGTGRLESRFLENCICPQPDVRCGYSGSQLMFKETTKQSLITCEEASTFRVCIGDEIAKEQHNLGNYVYYKINCVCPENENPRSFHEKMTVIKSFNEMTPMESLLASKHRRSRFFKCRGSRPSRRSIY